MRRIIKAAFVCALLFAVVGCNFFNWMHPPGRSDNTDVLMADGHAALHAGDYAQAKAIFEKVLAADPDNAQAMLGHATAVFREAGVDFVSLALSLSTNDKLFNLLDAEMYGLENSTELRQLIGILLADLEPIRKNQTDGSVLSDNVDVNLVLTISYTVKAAFSLQDMKGWALAVQDGDWQALPGNLTQEQADALIAIVQDAADTVGALLDLVMGEDLDVSIDDLIETIQDAVP